MELKLETGRIGYWIFLVFIYSSLHLLERVRRKDPVRAWFFLSIELFAVLINLLDSNWLVLHAFLVAVSYRGRGIGPLFVAEQRQQCSRLLGRQAAGSEQAYRHCVTMTP